MPRVRACPRGHEWEVADDRAAPANDTRCPVCGSAARMIPADVGRDGSSTILLPSDWQPIPSLNSDPPPNIPGFQILGELGRGGMGVVYQARPADQDWHIAIKVIRKERLLDEEAVRRFRREAQAAARADHPNVVRVIDFDQAGDVHYLMMEYVEGVTLQRMVDERGPLPIEQACDFIRQAATGLQHAHEQSLVHRDIKPSNLMVTTDRASAGTLKILDLGVARVLSPVGAAMAESLSTLKQTGSVIGTADYIAPEQLEDPHGADIRADLYSLGCTFYFLLTGQVPFPGGSLISKLDKQRWELPEPLDVKRPEISRAVASVVQKLMAKRPGDRYQSPIELARVLSAMARAGYQGEAAALLVPRRRLAGHADVVWSACFSRDGQRIATAGKDQTVIVWDADAGKPVRTLPKHSQEVRAVSFGIEPGQLVSASGLSVRLWDAEKGVERRRFSGHAGAVRCLTVCEVGQSLLTGSEDRTVRFWELQSGREVQRYTKHTAGVTCLSVIPGTDTVISGGRDQTLRIWDVRNGHELQVLSPDSGAVLAVVVSSDGRLAASAHFDTVIRVWELESGTELRQCEGHRQMVTSLAFTPDGRWLLSGSQDQTVRLWDVQTACELSNIAAGAGGINAVAISPSGQTALAAGSDGSVVLFEVAS